MSTETPAAELDEPMDIDAATVEAFERDGFVRVPGLFDRATVTALGPLVQEIVTHSAQATVPLDRRSVYQQAFIQEMNVWQRYAAARPYVFSTRLAKLAADLLGVDGVRLYHDQVLAKEAGGGRTPWHCDQYYWPLDTDRVVTAWLPLHDVPAEMGPLAFASGSHRIDLGRDLDISDESEQRIFRHPRWRELPVDEAPVRAGDVTFHQGWTFHGAGPNNTGDDRLVLTMIYLADGTTLAEPRTPGQHLDRAIWLPDTDVGAPVASWLNPLVWHRDGRHADTAAELPAPARRIGTIDLPHEAP